jgi:sugar/nucleoside kinase (ribokinase family)
MTATLRRPLDLLVVGDANPDLVLRGGAVEPAFGQQERIVEQGLLVLGGSGAITAVGAARLGLRTALAGVVGDDVLGRFVVGELAAAGVDTTAVRVLPTASTGISVALSRPDDRAILTARGALAAHDPAGLPDEVLRRARHVHIASPFLQPLLRDGLASLIARARAAGATVSLDPGWDPEQCWSTVARAALAADLLLPNEQEAAHLAAALGEGGGPSAPVPAEASAARLGAGGALVVVKSGADGAIAVRDGKVTRAAPYRVDAVDTTGAGDSFDAGFLAGWLGGADLAASLALGCACGALSTRRAGGTGGQPTRAEAEALVRAVS